MRSQYAGTITPPSPTITFGAGVTTATSAGSYSAYLQNRNRAGVTVFSPRIDFTVAAGQSIVVTIPSAVRQPASDLHEVILSVARNSTNPLDACVVATWAGYEQDGVTERSLPATITLTNDEHLELGKTVSSSRLLPQNPVHGMRRYVDTDEDGKPLAQVLAYDSQVLKWVPVYPASFSSYVASNAADGGCDRDCRDIDSRYIRIFDYDSSGSLSKPVKFWIVNTESGSIPQGTRIRLAVDINGDDYSSKLAGLMYITPAGFADPTTGALDSLGMSQVGFAFTYQGDQQTDLIIEKPLPSGSAYAFSIQLSFASFQLNNEVLQGSTIRFFPRFAQNFAKYDEGGELFGDYILPALHRRRIVPTAGGGAIALEGSGRVASYTFRNVGRQAIAGLVANTANQKCIITNNASCFIANTVPETGALRCILGTVEGVGKATEFKSAVALDSTKLLKVTVNYPSAVRSDYPDAIASTGEGQFNGSRVFIYVQQATSGDISGFEMPCTIGAASDEFIVGANTGVAVGTVLPTPAADFGLYEPTSDSFIFAAESGASIFAAETYNIAIAFVFTGTAITAISHAATRGCIKEVPSNFTELADRFTYWAEAVQTIDDLRLVPYNKRSPYQNRNVIETQSGSQQYNFIPDALDVDDGFQVIKPSDLDATTPGRWKVANRGPVPQLAIGSVTTTDDPFGVAAGFSGTPEAPLLDISIPRGRRGAPGIGVPGRDGESGPPGQDGATIVPPSVNKVVSEVLRSLDIQVGSVKTGTKSEARIERQGNTFLLHLTLEKGDRGKSGIAIN